MNKNISVNVHVYAVLLVKSKYTGPVIKKKQFSYIVSILVHFDVNYKNVHVLTYMYVGIYYKEF